jgi:hypothetical protein
MKEECASQIKKLSEVRTLSLLDFLSTVCTVQYVAKRELYLLL